MSDVSIIGLGEMGSAIASALLQSGRSITVWNRSAEKAGPLAARGVEVGADAVSAVAASPVSIVCVDNYEVSMAILGDARAALAGKTLVQLTSDTGTAADELAEWSAVSNARYLDGVILAYPSDMGSPLATVLLAGDIEAWTAVEPLMRDIAGASTYVGDNVRVPSMLSAAAIAPLLGLAVGAAQGAAMCEAEGFPVADYATMMIPLSGLLADQMRQTLATDRGGSFRQPRSRAQDLCELSEGPHRRGPLAKCQRGVLRIRGRSSDASCQPGPWRRGTLRDHQALALKSLWPGHSGFESCPISPTRGGNHNVSRGRGQLPRFRSTRRFMWASQSMSTVAADVPRNLGELGMAPIASGTSSSSVRVRGMKHCASSQAW